MASFHIEVKSHSKNKKNSKVSASKKMNYINREGQYSNLVQKQNVINGTANIFAKDVDLTEFDQDIKIANAKVDYITREGSFKNIHSVEDLQYKESGRMPEWASNKPINFWVASEKYERKNGTTFREFIFALPNELSLDENKDLIHDFIETNFPKNTYSFAIHKINATFAPELEQPHVHLIICERLNDGIKRKKEQYFSRYNPVTPEKGGAKKDRAWAGTPSQRAKHLISIRKSFADIQNKHLEKNNHNARVDHRKLEVQKEDAIKRGDLKKAKELDRPAEVKLGPKASRVLIKQLREYRKEHEGKNYNKDEFFEQENLNPKVIYNFTVRRIRELSKQIADEYEKREKQQFRKEKLPSIAMPAAKTTEELLNKIEQELKIVNFKINDIVRQKEKIAPKVKTEINAFNLAEFKLFYKEKQLLSDQKNGLYKEKKEYERQYQLLVNEGKPSIFMVVQRKNYEKKLKDLILWKNQINKKEIEYENNKHKLFLKTNTPQNKEKIDKLKNDIIAENKPIRDKFYLLVKSENELKQKALLYRNFIKELVLIQNINNRTMAKNALNNALKRFNKHLQQIEDLDHITIRAKLHQDEYYPNRG